MDATFKVKILRNIKNGDVRISEHGYDELVKDNLRVEEIFADVENAKMIEEYPEYPKGHCGLFLQADQYEQPIHTVWGIPTGFSKPAVLVTAYRPDPKKWNNNFTKRRKK